MRTRRIPMALVAASLAWATHATAQIATDGSVGARTTLSGPQYTIADALGTRVGINLLHSFSMFNVRAGESATFVGLGGIVNIIARVTGGSASLIDGPLRSAIPGSNLFLVNPGGLMFGPGASIDVPGSFHASTAHSLQLQDGTRIDMREATGVTLTVAPPSAFGFEGAAAPIALAGARLRVAEGRTLSLVGGDVTLTSGPGDRIAVLSAPSGTVEIQSNGTVSLRDGAFVSASEGFSGGGGGRVSIAGRNVLVDHASVESRTQSGDGRGIAITATEAIDVNGGNVISVTTGSGNAGGLALRARDITLRGGALVDTSCDPGCTTGAGGLLTVHADRNLAVIGDNAATPTFLVSNSFGGGRTGDIEIRAGSLAVGGNAFVQAITHDSGDGSTITLDTGAIDLSGGAQIDASTRGSGRGGDIVVRNAGDIRISGTRVVDATTGLRLPSGFFSSAEGSGNAGSIVISTATLEILSGGEVSGSAAAGSTGNGARIAITARDRVRVAGADADGKPSGIGSNTLSSGAAGNIEIDAPRIEIADEGHVQTVSEGSGRAGTIRIRGRTMELSGNGDVASDARAAGAGGVIDVALSESLTIRGGDSGIFSTAEGSGRGGSISVTAADVSIDGGGIFGLTRGTGAGGELSVRASRVLSLRGGGRISSESIDTGSGFAGNIAVSAGDTLDMNGGSISTAAREADGGDITIDVGRIALLRSSIVETQVGRGLGHGGNIVFRAPTLLMLGSVISANAFGGDGGNIRIATTTFLPSADSRVTASSTLGIDGTITFESPALDPTGELLLPAPAFVDVASVLAGRCGPRLAGRASSLVVLPHGPQPAAPDQGLFAVAACVPVPATTSSRSLPPSRS